MSQAPQQQAVKNKVGDWMPTSVLPSWTVSLLLHLALVILLLYGLQDWRRVPAGITDEDFREVGIYVKPPGDEREADSEPVEETEQAQAAPPLDQPIVPETPPAALELPELEPFEAIGTSPLVPTFPGLDPAAAIKANPAGRPQLNLSDSVGGVNFGGLSDKGTRIVYVVDSSSSMRGGPIQASKAELMRSLEGLAAIQQFAVVFYNNEPTALTLRGESRQAKLYFASEVNRTLARQQIAGVQAQLGTQHMPALTLALSLNPEVIFLLTDADQPELSRRDLDRISSRNRGRAHIHCIEFGQGPELDVDNFLKKLARQNEGTYRYQDVTEFEQR